MTLPEFQKAFTELNELLAAKFEGNPLLEYMDSDDVRILGRRSHERYTQSRFPTT